MKPKVLVHLPENAEHAIQYFEYLKNLSKNFEMEIIVDCDSPKFLELLQKNFPVIHRASSKPGDFLEKFKYFAGKLDKISYDYFIDLSEDKKSSLLAFLISAKSKLTSRPLDFISKKIYSTKSPLSDEVYKQLTPIKNKSALNGKVNDQYILVAFSSTDELIKRFEMVEEIAKQLVSTGIVITFDALIPGDTETISEWYRGKKFEVKIAFETDNSLSKTLSLMQKSYIFITQDDWLFEFSKMYICNQLKVADFDNKLNFREYLEKIEGAQSAPSNSELL